MTYHFNYHPYQRHFRQPLNTNHGIWKVREGIIVCLKDNLGNTGWGEIAPIPWFGSETLTQALDLCQQLGETITQEDILTISDRFPACQFGFESTLEDLFHTVVREVIQTENFCFLLPAGEEVLQASEKILQQYSSSVTLKWKIGVYPFDVEVEIFRQLSQKLPSKVRLRLDANGGLTLFETQQWLQVADRIGGVEFLEQPLPPQEFDKMLSLSQDYLTSLALDESVATINQLEDCYHKGWKGIFVIKIAIAGSPCRLRQFMSQHSIDAVFSSVFETTIGRQAALRLARELSSSDRAFGFGVNHWFVEDND